MRRSNEQSLKEAIKQMFQAYGLQEKFDETSIATLWPELIGKPIANRTKELFIHNKKLFLRIESSVVKNELVFLRTQILGRINEQVGRTIVNEIVFL